MQCVFSLFSCEVNHTRRGESPEPAAETLTDFSGNSPTYNGRRKEYNKEDNETVERYRFGGRRVAMPHEEAITSELQRVREATSSDFAALALTEEAGSRIGWKYASGSANDRYRRMRLKPGSGIAGLAIRLGRPTVPDRAAAERLRQECPVMLAEHLASAIAVPFQTGPERTAVLLVGARRERIYGPEDVRLVADAAARIAEWMPAGQK